MHMLHCLAERIWQQLQSDFVVISVIENILILIQIFSPIHRALVCHYHTDVFLGSNLNYNQFVNSRK